MAPSQYLVRLNLFPLWRRKVRVWGGEFLAVSFDRLLYLYLHRLGLMGREEKSFLEKRVRPGMHVVDIGANLGVYTLLLSRLTGRSGTVVAFEPDPELFEALQVNCRVNPAGNVELRNLAAGSRSGEMTLARSLVNAGDNRMERSGSPSGFVRRTVVPVATVDEIVAGRPVDFVKVDVQGWESEVLRGMTRVIASNPVLQIFLEYWPYGLRKAGCEPLELLRSLDAQGFRLYRISSDAIVRITDFSNMHEPTGKRYVNLYAVRDA